MLSRHSSFALAVLATLVCGNARGALIEAALTPRPPGDWLQVVIDEFNPAATPPNRWRAIDVDTDAAIDLATWRVGLHFDRSAFWLSADQPTVSIEGLSALQHGVALHDFAVELALGVDTVTVGPDVDPGHWWYSHAQGGRQVFLTLTPTPEPSTAVLALFGAAVLWRVRHSTASGS